MHHTNVKKQILLNRRRTDDIQVLGIGMFVLHGEPAGAGEPFRAAVEEVARRRAFAHPGGPVRVVLGTADDAATLRGAAALVLSHALHVAF